MAHNFAVLFEESSILEVNFVHSKLIFLSRKPVGLTPPMTHVYFDALLILTLI